MAARTHTIGSFAYSVGGEEVAAVDIANFDERWREVSPGTSFDRMGCRTYRRMGDGIEPHLIEAVRRTLDDAGLDGADVDHVVLAMSDPTVARLRHDFWPAVSAGLGLTACVPHLLTFQRCCSSVGALLYCRALARKDGDNVVLVGLDFTPDDAQRIQPYALFADGVASCLLTVRPTGPLHLRSVAVAAEAAGIAGDDSFTSRQALADRAMGDALEEAGVAREALARVFPANLYLPLVLFNAAASGLTTHQLHFEGSLAKYGHCGNADWMINLADYHATVGLKRAETYLAQSVAQGFHACAVFEGTDST